MTRSDDSVLDRLERLAARRPSDVAIVHAGVPVLTYAALWERVSGLGAAIRRRGVTPGSIVVVDLEKSPDWVIAVLGTWWAGAAFLPIAPTTPDERLAAIVEAARPVFALAAGSSAGVLRGHGVPVIGAGDGLDVRDRESGQASPRAQTRPDDLAYVIFTSGSTGRPKGVMVSHRGIVPLLDAQVVAFGLRPGCRAL